MIGHGHRAFTGPVGNPMVPSTTGLRDEGPAVLVLTKAEFVPAPHAALEAIGIPIHDSPIGVREPRSVDNV